MNKKKSYSPKRAQVVEDQEFGSDGQSWDSDILEKELEDTVLVEGKSSGDDFESPSDDGPLLPVPMSTDVALYRQGPTLDSLTHYIRQINQYELLSPEQEKALALALVETGDINVAKRLVLANLRLVVKISMEYRHAYSNVMDLIQEGNIGLMKAVSKYDITKGAKLSYYASWWIRSYILKFILENFRLVKIGTTNEQKKLFYNLLREKNRLLSMGVEPDTKTISENLGVSEKSVQTMSKRLGPSGGEVSIDRPLLTDESGAGTLQDMIGDEQPPVDETLGDLQGLEILKEHLADFVAELKPRDREIFSKRLLTEVPPSLQSVADEYGVSRERIRQIEQRLIENLKVYMSEFIR